MTVSADGLVLSATDLEVSARLSLDVQVGSEGKALVPERALTEAGRAAATDEKGHLELYVEPSQVAFVIGSLMLTSRLIEGEFPNYRELLPDRYENKLVVSRQQLSDAVKRVGLL